MAVGIVYQSETEVSRSAKAHTELSRALRDSKSITIRQYVL